MTSTMACVPNGGGSPLRHEEDHGGSIVFACVYETGGYEIWTPVSMASYWLKVVSRPPRLLEDSAWLFPHKCFYSIEGVIARFVWQFLLAANYFGVPVILLTMSFWAEPKYFPWLRQSGIYVLKDCRFFNIV